MAVLRAQAAFRIAQHLDRYPIAKMRPADPVRLGHKAKRARYAGRAAAASIATGLGSRHKAEQEALVSDALTIEGK